MLVARDLWVTPAGAPDAIVRGVSFEVGRGEWLAVTGSNGCGKTTLALAAAGLVPPAKGSIEWCGLPATLRAARPGFGPVMAVLQDPSTQLLQPTVAEELRFTAANLGHDLAMVEREVSRIASRLGLDGSSRLDPQLLSAGGQQLVLIAAALVCGPGLLVADEPCAHLDAGGRARVLELVEAERSRGLTVVWVTQSAEEAARAGRTLELAGSPPTPARPAAVLAEGAVALEVHIASDPGGDGPRIRTAQPLDLEIRSPGLLALWGPNGSGKSVLLGSLCGLVTCDQISLRTSHHRRSGAAAAPLLVSQYPELMVFQDRVDEELAFAAVSRGLSRASALEHGASLLRALELNPERLIGRSVWDLSTGEKRLVELVAGLIAPAGLLALDEPTGGLDPFRRSVLADLVRNRAERGAIVVASQDPEWIGSLGCRSFDLGAPARLPSVGQNRD